MDELAMGRFVLVRALMGLGDFLCVTPALRSLRLAYPSAHIALVGVGSTRALVMRYSHLIDEFIPFPGFPGIPEVPLDVTRLPPFLAEMQARSFALAVQMHGNGSSTNAFTVLLGAKRTAGFHAAGAYCPDPSLYLPLDEEEHEVKRWLRLVAHLGAPAQGEDLEFPLSETDAAVLARAPEAAALREGYVVIHPGATDPARRWLPAHFAAVADHFAAEGRQVVLTGTADEAPIVAEVEAAITNDTGVSHLAAALRVPSIVIFLASNPRRWAPLDRRLHRVVGRDGLQPDDVAPGQVLREANLLLALRGAHRARPVEAARREVARA